MKQKRIDRRQFLRDMSVSVAGAGLGLNALDVASARAAVPAAVQSSSPATMKYRDLGKTGMKVSAVSFGVMTLTDPAVLFKALDRGINYFDTAWMYQYGKNEELLGKVNELMTWAWSHPKKAKW